MSEASFHFRLGKRERSAATEYGRLQPTAEVKLGDFNPLRINGGEGHFRIDIMPGEHSLSLGGNPIVIACAQRCRCTVKLKMLRYENKAQIEHIAAQFSVPILLKNCFTTMEELRMVFGESQQEEWLEKFQIPKALLSLVKGDGEEQSAQSKVQDVLKETLAWVDKRIEDVAQRLDTRFGGIELESFEIRNLEHLEGAKLHCYFSGHFVISDKLRIPFRDNGVPEFLLPTFFADIGRLFSESWGKGGIRMERSKSNALSESFIVLLKRISGSFEADLDIPASSLTLRLPDRTNVIAGIEEMSAFRLKTDIDMDQIGDTITVLASSELRRETLTDLCIEIDASMKRETLTHILTAMPEQVSFQLLAEAGTKVNEAVSMRVRVSEGAKIGDLRIKFDTIHEILKGGAYGKVFFDNMSLKSDQRLIFDAESGVFYPTESQTQIRGELRLDGKNCFDSVRLRSELEQFAGTFSVALSMREVSAFSLLSHVEADTKIHTEYIVPELSSDDVRCDIGARLLCDLKCKLSDSSSLGYVADFSQSTIEINDIDFQAFWHDYILKSSDRFDMRMDWLKAPMTDSGPGDNQLSLAWDFGISPPVIRKKTDNACFRLLPDSWLQRKLVIDISKAGLLRVSEPERDRAEVYDARFINALLNPKEEIEKWRELLDRKNIGKDFYEPIRIFSPQKADFVAMCGDKLAFALKEFKKRKLRMADIWETENGALFLSLLLSGSDTLCDRITPILLRVVKAEGFDRYEVEEFVAGLFPSFDYEFELSMIVKVIDKLLRPIPFINPEESHFPALCENAEFSELCRALPSAKEIYETTQQESAAQCLDYAAGLSVYQLSALLRDKAQTTVGRRLAALLSFKKQIHEHEHSGGAYLLQDMSIAAFLFECLEADRLEAEKLGIWDKNDHILNAFRSILSPEDCAILLFAGISFKIPGRILQNNQHALFKHLLKRGKAFVSATLYELSRNSAHVLTARLMSFFDQSQSLVKRPVNRSEMLSECLGIDFPRREDYMSGGKFAKKSYYADLYDTCEKIIKDSCAYRAAKMHLQVYRHALPSCQYPAATSETFKRYLAQADREADNLKRNSLPEKSLLTLEYDAIDDAKAQNAARAYAKVYAECAEALKHSPAFITDADFKDFAHRTHDMLSVSAAMRNMEDNDDRCRAWLRARHNARRFSYDRNPKLFRALIDTIYHNAEDKERIANDPLVRLLPDIPQKKVDLTIVCAMGVITDGADGRELETSFERLNQRHDVKILRCDTGTARTLAYNSARIIHALSSLNSPFALLGYSQGCANAMEAERRLMGSSPEYRDILKYLVSRQFLFSASNGSSHGQAGAKKYSRFLRDGETFLKFFQTVLPPYSVKWGIKIIQTLLDSPYLSHFLGSTDSLRSEGLDSVNRDAQYMPFIPSYSVAGIATPDICPRALEYMLNISARQEPGMPYDTQVSLQCARGYSVFNRNDNVDALRLADLPTSALHAHHWAPLDVEVDTLRTQRDENLHIYDFPRDVLVFPWIESLILFGKI